jgi:SAM-dependent methyltransferase
VSNFSPENYWEDRLSRSYHEGGVGDITLTRSYNAFLYRVRRAVFRRVVRQIELVPTDATVLDVGSGTGVYVEEWLRWGARKITGVDITRASVTRLAERFPALKFVRADVGSELPAIPGRPFDVISAFDVFFHIVDDRSYSKAMRNIADLLRPGGWFFYSDNLPTESLRMEHYVRRSETTVLDELRSAGFDIIARAPMFVLMNAPSASTNKLLRKWFAAIHHLASTFEVAGLVTGSLLFPFELAATAIVRRGPSTEVLICRKRVSSRASTVAV